MKSLKPFLFLVLVVPFFGCELVEDALEQEFDVPISFAGDLVITSETAVSDPNDPITVTTEIATYNIASDPDVANAIDDKSEIKKVKIERIRFSYKDFVGNEEAFVIEAAFVFIDPSRMAIERYEILDQGIRVAEADRNNQGFFLEDDFSAIEEGLSNGISSILISYNGKLSHNPVDFKVGITVDVTVTIKPEI